MMDNHLSEKIDIEGQEVTIRALTSEDVNLERYLIDHLSAESRHFRFLGGVHHLTDKQLKQLCDIDFDHRMAFIALIENDGQKEPIGISRYATDQSGEGHEFAVTVTDKWQNKGLGTLLMRKLIRFSKEHSVKRLYSIDSAVNTHMQQLARDLEMDVKQDPEDAHQVIYSLSFE